MLNGVIKIMIKKYNISKPKKYVDGQGQQKTFWQNIGTITEFWKEDGGVSRILEIPAIGLEANIFPIIPKENQYQPKEEKITNINNQIELEEIPF